MAKRKSTAPAAPMPPAPDGNPFHAKSVLTCEECGMEVAVSYGGWANMALHKTSKEHAARIPRRDRLPAMKKLKDGNISSFFKAPKTYSAPAPPKLGGLATAPLVGDEPPLPALIDSIATESDALPTGGGIQTVPRPARPPDCALIEPLRTAIEWLPPSVPGATNTDVLAKYAVPPIVDPSADKEDLWIEINTMLNRDFGYGKRSQDLVPIMRRGELGLDGFANYINACIVDIGLDAALFEMRVHRVIEAIQVTPGIPSRSRSGVHQMPRTPEIRSSLVIDLTEDDPPFPSAAESAAATAPSPAPPSRSPGDVMLSLPAAASRKPAAVVSPLAASSPRAPCIVPCLGHHVVLPDNLPAGQSFEWGSETSAAGDSLLWRGNVFQGKLYIQAESCLGLNAVSSLCVDCEAIFPTPSVQNLIRRILHGVHESTNTNYLSWRNMHESNNRLRRENNSRKLNALTLARKLTRVTSKLDTHKRLVYAIAEVNVPRVQVVVSVALRNKRGAAGILQQLRRAQDHVYKPRSYTEADYSLANLILRLGGDAALGVASRACGLPTRSTVHRHTLVPPLRISHGYPSLADVAANIDSVFPMSISPPAYGTKVGAVLMIDETKLEQRQRWDPKTNAIVGTCREHSDHVDLIFRSMDQAHAVADALQAKTIHYATEMTVAALGLLVPNSREHVARPIQISGSCKRETAREHASLINTLVEASSTHAKLEHVRVLCIATDGEAKRGSALVPITLSRTLPASSPIYSVLHRLVLFNLLCGKGDLTLDKDFKHLFKRFRAMLLRLQGINIFDFLLTADMIKRHLLDEGLDPSHVKALVDPNEAQSEQTLAITRNHLLRSGMTPSHIDALMNPNDKQDVVLAYSLLVAVMKLPKPNASHNERYAQVRRRLNFLGALFGYLLKPYTTLSMSLSEQLRSLASAQFMLLALYSAGRGSVMPVQLYADTAHMVKNAFFCVAKLQVDDPEGEMHLILLGDDRLEASFGNMRCMQPNDSNTDILQGASRFSAGMEVAIAFSEHPEWDRTKRRLYLAPLDVQGDIVDRGVDHISPRSWTGDVRVKHVSLLTCWDAGRKAATLELEGLGVPVPFNDMEAAGNIDILRPLGRWCFNDSLLDGEVDEVFETTNILPPGPPAEDGGEMDLEDHAGAELAAALLEEQGPHAAHEPWVLDGGAKLFKASVCRLLSDPAQLAGGGSTDRMRRFAGYNKYDYGAPANDDPGAETEDDYLMVNDTATTLLRCQDIAFLALIIVGSLKLDGRLKQSLPRSAVSSAQVGFQVLRLVPQEPSPENSYDWRCEAETIKFGTSSTLLWTSACLVEPIDQDIDSSKARNQSRLKTEFKTDELNALTMLLLEAAESYPDLELPSIDKVDRYPYHLKGKLCFSAQKPDNALVGSDKLKCAHCTSSKIKIDSPVALLTHNAAHLLYDSSLRKSVEYCGFCLSTSMTCRFYLKCPRSDAKNQQIDLANSKCPKLPDQISYGPASKSSKKTPGTNVPIYCPLCEDRAPAVWRYNFPLHLAQVHPEADAEEYKNLWELTRKEKDGLHEVWERLGSARNTRKAPRPLILSEGHSAHLALRTTDLVEADDISSDQAAARCAPSTEPEQPLEHQAAADEVHAEFTPPDSSGPSSSSVANSALVTGEDPSVPVGAESAPAAASVHGVDGGETAPAPPSVPITGKRKRGRTRAQVHESCNCGEEIQVQSANLPSGIVECISKGCETRFYHERCALLELKTRALPSQFICASCKAEGATRAKRHRD